MFIASVKSNAVKATAEFMLTQEDAVMAVDLLSYKNIEDYNKVCDLFRMAGLAIPERAKTPGTILIAAASNNVISKLNDDIKNLLDSRIIE